MIARIIATLVQRWQAKCPHDPRYVWADVLQGDGQSLVGTPIEVRWCLRCGAHRRYWPDSGALSEWRSPDARAALAGKGGDK